MSRTINCHWMHDVVTEKIFNNLTYNPKTNEIFAPCSNICIGKNLKGKIVWNKKLKKQYC